MATMTFEIHYTLPSGADGLRHGDYIEWHTIRPYNGPRQRGTRSPAARWFRRDALHCYAMTLADDPADESSVSGRFDPAWTRRADMDRGRSV